MELFLHVSLQTHNKEADGMILSELRKIVNYKLIWLVIIVSLSFTCASAASAFQSWNFSSVDNSNIIYSEIHYVAVSEFGVAAFACLFGTLENAFDTWNITFMNSLSRNRVFLTKSLVAVAASITLGIFSLIFISAIALFEMYFNSAHVLYIDLLKTIINVLPRLAVASAYVGLFWFLIGLFIRSQLVSISVCLIYLGGISRILPAVNTKIFGFLPEWALQSILSPPTFSSFSLSGDISGPNRYHTLTLQLATLDLLAIIAVLFVGSYLRFRNI